MLFSLVRFFFVLVALITILVAGLFFIVTVLRGFFRFLLLRSTYLNLLLDFNLFSIAKLNLYLLLFRDFFPLFLTGFILSFFVRRFFLLLWFGGFVFGGLILGRLFFGWDFNLNVKGRYWLGLSRCGLLGFLFLFETFFFCLASLLSSFFVLFILTLFFLFV